MRPGKNALRARCSRTEESLPMEYISSGLENSAATSRKMWMLSASSRARWVSLARARGAAAAGGRFQGRNCLFLSVHRDLSGEHKTPAQGRQSLSAGDCTEGNPRPESIFGYAGITPGLRGGDIPHFAGAAGQKGTYLLQVRPLLLGNGECPHFRSLSLRLERENAPGFAQGKIERPGLRYEHDRTVAGDAYAIARRRPAHGADPLTVTSASVAASELRSAQPKPWSCSVTRPACPAPSPRHAQRSRS